MNAEAQQRSEKFAVGDAARLKLANLRGRVDIRAAAPGEISVTAVKHADGNMEQTAVEISQAADGTVNVETRFPGWATLLGARRPCRVDYTVRVPAACALELAVVESDAFVQGLTGDFVLNTVSGSLRLADLTGSLRLHTVSGSVLAERLTATGPVDLHAVSGSVTLLESDLPAATGSTVSGDLNLQTRLVEGPYIFNSVSGNIRLSVPAGTRCSLELHSQSGRVHSNVPVNGPRRAGDGPAPLVRLHSVSGGLWVVSPEGEAGARPPAPQAPEPARPPTPPERMDVLNRVASGEISVEEAMAALKVQ